MKSETLLGVLALCSMCSLSACREEKRAKALEPKAAQTYLEQCVQALELARDPKNQQIAAGVTTCESAALGDVSLKKPERVLSSTVQLDGSRLVFSVSVVDSSGKTLSSETDPATYNRMTLQRKAIGVAMGRAGQAYVLECYKALYGVFADKADLKKWPPHLTSCESPVLAQYALRKPGVVRSSKVGPLDPARADIFDNISIEVTLETGQVYYWDGRTASLKP